MKLLAGLGNPGLRYARTRHNAGFMVVDRVARVVRASSWRRRFGARICEAPGLIVIKPQTYMNLSGDSLWAVSVALGVPASDLLVILDDMDLEVGRIRIRQKGGSAGHKGMQSIIDRLATNEIPRIRVGIGRPAPGADPVQYVLERPVGRERELFLEAMSIAAEAAVFGAAQGIEAAMNRYNASPAE